MTCDRTEPLFCPCCGGPLVVSRATIHWPGGLETEDAIRICPVCQPPTFEPEGDEWQDVES